MRDASRASPPIDETAARILERHPSRTMPISRLHRALTRELGPALPDASALEERLRARAGRFVVLAAPGFAWARPGWVRERHAEYATALEDAGLAVEPRVALASLAERAPGAEPAAELLRRLDRSILSLSRGATDDPTLSVDLAEAMARARELQRAVRRDGR